jgi:hypothetical protein
VHLSMLIKQFLTLARDGDEWSSYALMATLSLEIAPGTHWIGSWVGTSIILDPVE